LVDKPVVGSEIVQQPVDIDPLEVVDGAVSVVSPAAVGQGDAAQVKGLSQGSSISASRQGGVAGGGKCCQEQTQQGGSDVFEKHAGLNA
jgi:hypothetical protein